MRKMFRRSFHFSLLPESGWFLYLFWTYNWVDEAYNDVGFSTIHNIDISGKTDRISYYFSGGYNRQNGMLRYGNDIYNRYNLRTKLQFKLTDWWSLSSNVSLTTSDYDYANAMTNTYKQMYRKIRWIWLRILMEPGQMPV